MESSDLGTRVETTQKELFNMHAIVGTTDFDVTRVAELSSKVKELEKQNEMLIEQQSSLEERLVGEESRARAAEAELDNLKRAHEEARGQLHSTQTRLEQANRTSIALARRLETILLENRRLLQHSGSLVRPQFTPEQHQID